MSYDEDRETDRPWFEVSTACSACGATATVRNDTDTACPCGTVTSQSYDSRDVARWNADADRRRR